MSESVEPDRAKARGERAVDLARQAVADHRRLPGICLQQRQGVMEDAWVGLADPQVTGDDDRVEEIGKPGRRQLLALQA